MTCLSIWRCNLSFYFILMQNINWHFIYWYFKLFGRSVLTITYNNTIEKRGFCPWYWYWAWDMIFSLNKNILLSWLNIFSGFPFLPVCLFTSSKHQRAYMSSKLLNWSRNFKIFTLGSLPLPCSRLPFRKYSTSI